MVAAGTIQAIGNPFKFSFKTSSLTEYGCSLLVTLHT